VQLANIAKALDLVAFPFARAKAGNNKLAKMAMMAITTNNSMRVNACLGKILIWRCSFWLI